MAKIIVAVFTLNTRFDFHCVFDYCPVFRGVLFVILELISFLG